MKFLYMFAMLSFVSLPRANAQVARIEKPAAQNQRPQFVERTDFGLRVEFDHKGELQYFRRSNSGSFETISALEFQKSIEELASKALKIACTLAAIPDEVNATVGVFSITWKLDDKLCKKYRS